MAHPIPDAALAAHIAILGKTGSGKTYAAKGVVEATEADKAYAAGFFDGEGTVFIASRQAKDARGAIYSMRVMASQVDPTPLAWMQARWGGSIVPRSGSADRRPSFTWNCLARQAASFLRDIRPFLIVKDDEADVALEFQESLFNPGQRGHSAEYRNRQEASRNVLMELKRGRERLAV